MEARALLKGCRVVKASTGWIQPGPKQAPILDLGRPGRGVALLYAREGADLAIIYLEEEQSDAEETRDAIQSEGRQCPPPGMSPTRSSAAKQ